MPRPSLFRLLIALCAITSILVGCSSASPTTSSTPSSGPSTVTPSPGKKGHHRQEYLSTLPKCELPPEIEFPDWVPADLPIPNGTYAYDRLTREYGYYRGLFVLPLLSTQFGRYVLERWPAAGFQLGRGDQEPGEVEAQFVRPPAAGAFKARDVVCRDPASFLLLFWAPQGPKDTTTPPQPLPGSSPSPGATPLQPSPSPF
jgi:hypothetical protein